MYVFTSPYKFLLMHLLLQQASMKTNWLPLQKQFYIVCLVIITHEHTHLHFMNDQAHTREFFQMGQHTYLTVSPQFRISQDQPCLLRNIPSVIVTTTDSTIQTRGSIFKILLKVQNSMPRYGWYFADRTWDDRDSKSKISAKPSAISIYIVNLILVVI